MTVLRAGRRLAASASRLRAARTPRWWQEVGFVGAIYGLYTLVRNAVPAHETGAFSHARTILGIERGMHLDVEQSLNGYVAHHSWLAYGCDYYYSTLHFVVTIGVLVWLYRRHPLRYRDIRSVLIITNLVALVGFWFIAVAPPRMLPGYTDTVVEMHTWGSLASPGMAQASNQFAAMPSLHIGWSLWCALAVVPLARRRWVRVLAVLYPVVTTFVIIGTANHFVLDAVGGVATLGVALLVQRALPRRHATQDATVALPDVGAEPELVTA